MATGSSFARKVKKANLSSAQSKNVSACFMEHGLHHNRWYKGKTPTAGSVDPVTYHHKFENMLTSIGHGTEDHQRVGDENLCRETMPPAVSFLTCQGGIVYHVSDYSVFHSELSPWQLRGPYVVERQR